MGTQISELGPYTPECMSHGITVDDSRTPGSLTWTPCVFVNDVNFSRPGPRPSGPKTKVEMVIRWTPFRETRNRRYHRKNGWSTTLLVWYIKYLKFHSSLISDYKTLTIRSEKNPGFSKVRGSIHLRGELYLFRSWSHFLGTYSGIFHVPIFTPPLPSVGVGGTHICLRSSVRKLEGRFRK